MTTHGGGYVADVVSIDPSGNLYSAITDPLTN